MEERRQAQMRWGAVFAGTITAISVWILLQLLGAGIGLSAIDTEQGSNLRGVGIGTGLWSAIAPLIAVFIGAVVGGRLAGTRDRRVGALHGVVMWGLTLMLGVFFVVSTVSAVASGVVRVGGEAAKAAGSAVKEAVPDMNAEDMLQQPQTQERLEHIGEQAKQTGLQAGHAVGRGMLWAGIGALVALIAAIAGGALGVPTRRESETMVRETVVEPPAP